MMNERKETNKSGERARVTLGTFAGLGLDGKLLEDVSAVMRGWRKIERRRCLGCRQWLVGAVSCVPCGERAADPNDPLTHCDACWKALNLGMPDAAAV